MSYIIKNNFIIAETTEALASGAEVLFATEAVKEEIDANRELNLVNAKCGKISNAKKWAGQAYNVGLATEVNPGEYLI